MQRVLQTDKLHTERYRKSSHEIRPFSKLCPSGSFVFVVLALPVTPTSIQNNTGLILLVLVLLLMVVLVGGVLLLVLVVLLLAGAVSAE